jgi:glyoxylase-like metal-dependent hydrolase (beta-lactamase superfamily II)
MKIVEDVFLVGSGQIRLSNAMDCHVYLINGGSELALIDAGVGLDTNLILENVRQEGFSQKDIHLLLLTHTHADHAGGCKKIREATGCEVVTSEIEGTLLENGGDEELGLDAAKRSNIYPKDYIFPHCKVDWTIKDNEAIKVGKYSIRAILVPGHSRGSVCYLLDKDGYKILFSSDTVFFGGTIGLGNWPGSSLEDYRKNIGKLGNLSVDALLPGHFLWTLKDGQAHVNKAIENLKLAWVPPAWQHQHPHF